MEEDRQDIEFFDLLEDTKKEYEEYLELSKVYELSDRQEKTVQYEPPSPKNPLTTNSIYE